MRAKTLLGSLAVALCFLASTKAEVVFTVNTNISADNLDYEGSNIVVRGCTVGVEGAHAFGAMTVQAGTLDQRATNLMLQALTVASNSFYQLVGGATLNVANDVILANASQLIMRGTNTAGKVGEVWAGCGGTLLAGSVYVGSDCTIQADSQGYRSATANNETGKGPGGGAGGGGTGGGGGSYGGTGGAGAGGAGGGIYGDGLQPLDLGSGGGRGDEGAGTGHGGGAIRLVVEDTLALDGVVSADGGNGSLNDVGGGSGGSIWATVGILSGSGKFHAIGGNGTTYAGAGGGGRIAVYYRTSDAFGGFTNSSVSAGTSHDGLVGTLAFINTASGTVMRITQNYEMPSNTVAQYQSLLVENGATLTIGGGSTVTVAGVFSVVSNSTVICKAINNTAMVNSNWVGVGVYIRAGQAIIESGSRITADAQGYRSASANYEVGKGLGGGAGGDGTGGGGAGYGGVGGTGAGGAGGMAYGSSVEPVELGSGGGRGDNGTGTGHGGGAIHLMVDSSLTVDGIISANGGHGSFDDVGGGSGGSIWITTDSLTGNGAFQVVGGNGTTYAGAGGGGRIAVYYRQSSFTGFTNCTAVSGSTRSGQVGTLGFFDTSLGAGQYSLFVPSMRFDYPRDSAVTFDRVSAGLAGAVSTAIVEVGESSAFEANRVSFEKGAQWVVGGASTVTVFDTLQTADSNTAIWCQGKNTSALVNSNWAGIGVTLYVSNLVVGADTRLTADAQGYRSASANYEGGKGPGGGAAGGGSGGGGGGHGEVGGAGAEGAGGVRYDSAILPLELGSGGGRGDEGAGTGHGGGAIQLYVSGALTLDGTITANGGHGSMNDVGGGSGGSILAVVRDLSGAGYFAANGGDGTTYAGAGAGGRVAIYHEMGGLTDCAASTANSGANRMGGTGTVGFFRVHDRNNFPTDPARSLSVFRTFRYETEGDVVSLSNVWVGAGSSGALLVLAGGIELQASGTVSVENASTILCLGRNAGAQVSGVWAGQGVNLSATFVRVDSSSAIQADAQGYRSATANNGTGKGPGGGAGGGGTGGGGGGHGGIGGAGVQGVGGNAYGFNAEPTTLGSGGGRGDEGEGTGHGGGAVKLTVIDTLTLNGRISANGGNGSLNDVGGGAGGSLWVTTRRLEGFGMFQANGGNGTTYAGAGAGGRVAVYYSEQDYSGFAASRVASGTSREGEAGTIGFFEEAGANHHLNVYHNYTLTTDARVVYASLTLHTGATFRTDGGADIVMDGNLNLATGAVLTARSKNTSSEVSGEWAGEGLAISASNVLVAAGALVTAAGQGYRSASGYNETGKGPGGGAGGGNTGGGGGGYGGAGGAGAGGAGGVTNGSCTMPLDLGSGGGRGDEGAATGNGGGAIQFMIGGDLTVDGEINANGASGSLNDVGGGSGGSLLVSCEDLAGTGILSANGGNGTTYAGAGGGGRIAIYYWGSVNLPEAHVQVNPGTSRPGQTGTIYQTSSPVFSLENPAGELLHDTATIRWIALGVEPNGFTAELQAFRDGVATPIASGVFWGSATWNTIGLSDGMFEIRVVFYDSQTQCVGQAQQNVLVNNSVIWHSHRIGSNETWASGTVHVVESTVTVPSGITVTVQPGAIVKMAVGTRIIVETGGTFDARGAGDAMTVITSLRDDTAGGDTNLDGGQTHPQPGDWQGFAVAVGGTLLNNELTDIRYSKTTHSGTISSDELWLGTYVHEITGTLVIPADVTLTIQPGAVIKVGVNVQWQVNSGGSLQACGTAAQPITITSIRDDTVGGDSNGDGDQTAPEAGDWAGIFLTDAVGVFDHVQLRYGGGPAAGGWGPSGGPGKAGIKTSGSSFLSFSNSVMQDAFYDGLLCWGGSVFVGNSVFKGIDRAICAHPGSPVTVRNCTLDNNGVGLLIHGGSLNVANTIVANSIRQGILHDYAADDLSIRYSCLWNATNAFGTTQWTVGVDGNISSDPKFKNTTNDTYQLNFVSPCIDAADGPLAPDTDFVSAPRYDDPRMPNTGIVCANGQYADMGAYEFVELADSDIDLVVAHVMGPLTAVGGGQAEVRWIVANIGTANAVGPWYDLVSLVRMSPTNEPSISAAEARVGTGVILGPGQTCEGSAVVTVPCVTEGEYLWEVRANRRRTIFEGRNETNNTTRSDAAVTVTLPDIVVGGTVVTGTFSAVGETRTYRLMVVTNGSLMVQLDSADNAGVVELYIGKGYVPSRDHYDVVQIESGSPDATAFLAAAEPGTYYITAYASTLQAVPSEFTVQARVVDFEITSVSPTNIGNKGWSVLTVYGGGFDMSSGVYLQQPGMADLVGRIIHKTNTSVSAVFHVVTDVLGVWDVIVTNTMGAMTVLPGGVTVEEGRGSQIWADIVGRDTVRAGRPEVYTLLIGNRGNVDAAVIPFVRGAPTDTVWKIEWPPPPVADGVVIPWEEFSRFGTNAQESAIEFPVTYLPAGYTFTVRLRLLFPRNGAFQISIGWDEL